MGALQADHAAAGSRAHRQEVVSILDRRGAEPDLPRCRSFFPSSSSFARPSGTSVKPFDPSLHRGIRRMSFSFLPARPGTSTSAATGATACTTRKIRCPALLAAAGLGRDDGRDRRRADGRRRAGRAARSDRRPHHRRRRFRGRSHAQAYPQPRCRSRARPAFAGTKIPTLAEVLEWAKRRGHGIVLEIKEVEQPDLAVDRAAALSMRPARPIASSC